MAREIQIVFDGPPGHDGGRFVEVEDGDGKSIRFGTWLKRKDGYWALQFSLDEMTTREIKEPTP